MTIYTAYDDGLPVSEWITTTTITLDDVGGFVWDVLSTCYFGSAGGEAKGRWHRRGQNITFTVQESTLDEVKVGQRLSATENDGELIFPDGFRLKRSYE